MYKVNSETSKQLYNEYEEIDIRELLMLLWSKKIFITGLTIVMIIIAGIYSFYVIDPVYQAKTTVQLSNTGDFYSNPATAMRLLKSNAIVMPIMEELGEDYSEAEVQGYLGGNMTLGNPDNTKIVDISLKSADPIIAQKLLTGIITSYKEEADIQYNRIINNSKENLATIENSLDLLDEEIKSVNQDMDNISNSDISSTEKSILMSGLTNKISTYIEQRNSLVSEKRAIEEKLLSYQSFQILNQAYVSEDPVSPNKMLNIAIAAVLGIMIAIFLVFFIEFLKDDEESGRA